VDATRSPGGALAPARVAAIAALVGSRGSPGIGGGQIEHVFVA
jgi:hypothetical protein